MLSEKFLFKFFEASYRAGHIYGRMRNDNRAAATLIFKRIDLIFEPKTRENSNSLCLRWSSELYGSIVVSTLIDGATLSSSSLTAELATWADLTEEKNFSSRCRMGRKKKTFAKKYNSRVFSRVHWTAGAALVFGFCSPLLPWQPSQPRWKAKVIIISFSERGWLRSLRALKNFTRKTFNSSAHSALWCLMRWKRREEISSLKA